MTNTSTGLEENVAGLLCYVLGWITGVIFLIIERESKFVRFHAIQSIIVFGVLNLIGPLTWIPFIGWVLGVAIAIITLVLWILLMVRAYHGEQYKVPIAGDLAERWV
jgi:uncharacterized membrane protein